MSKNHKYDYADASYSRCGLMNCAACGKKIESGEFRYRMAYDKWFNDTGYVTFHRACTENDPNWKKQDAQRAANAERNSNMLKACIEFKAMWGVSELDELIDELKESHEQN